MEIEKHILSIFEEEVEILLKCKYFVVMNNSQPLVISEDLKYALGMTNATNIYCFKDTEVFPFMHLAEYDTITDDGDNIMKRWIKI